MGLLKRISNLQILKNHHFGNIHSSIPQKKQFFFFLGLVLSKSTIKVFLEEISQLIKKAKVHSKPATATSYRLDCNSSCRQEIRPKLWERPGLILEKFP